MAEKYRRLKRSLQHVSAVSAFRKIELGKTLGAIRLKKTTLGEYRTNSRRVPERMSSAEVGRCGSRNDSLPQGPDR
jgi:hypothetical protein